jgi:hypothetical protein
MHAATQVMVVGSPPYLELLLRGWQKQFWEPGILGESAAPRLLILVDSLILCVLLPMEGAWAMICVV